MEPYRVDRDAGATIPIETLHHEIRSAGICLADITTLNPNVMYELGYAIAAGKDVVLISGPATQKFPFDIQHRTVICYSLGSPGDFKRLGDSISSRLKTLLEKQAKTTEIMTASPVKSSDGLQPHEMTVLALIMANGDSREDDVAAWTLKQEMNKAGYSDIGTRLSLAKLVRTGLAESRMDEDINGRTYVLYRVTEAGESWLLENQNTLQLRLHEDPNTNTPEADGISDDDVPF
jgi:nucleoside 2-deoxyribosyltransferase